MEVDDSKNSVPHSEPPEDHEIYVDSKGRTIHVFHGPLGKYEVWDWKSGDDEEDSDYEEYYNSQNDSPPKGCLACGGPYPLCKDGCPIFDDN